MENLEPAKPKCRDCKGDINPGAVLCLHCKSYQNWRRHVNVSSSVLALLVALVSVVSATLPQIINTMRRGSSEAQISLLGCNAKDFVVLAVNNGDRRSVISRVSLDLGNMGKFPFLVEGSRIITGQEAREVSVSADDPKAFEYLLHHIYWTGGAEERIDRAEVGKNKLIIEVLHFDGHRETQTLPVPAEDFERLLINIFPERGLPGPPIPVEPL